MIDIIGFDLLLPYREWEQHLTKADTERSTSMSYIKDTRLEYQWTNAIWKLHIFFTRFY